jgi:hypothetical protein
MKHRLNQFVQSLLMVLLLLCLLLLPSCTGGGGFSSGPPVIASAGGSAFFLFPVKSGEGTPYFVGGSTSGDVAVQWKQADGSTVLLVKPKRGDVVFYLDGKRVGEKQANPVIPPGVVVPDTVPKTAAEAKEVVEPEPVPPVVPVTPVA